MFYQRFHQQITIYHSTELYSAEHNHMHNEIEIVYCLHGSFDAIIDKNKTHIRPGGFSIAFPNQQHYYNNVSNGFDCYILIFSLDVVPEIAGLCLVNSPKSSSGTATNPNEVCKNLELISNIYQQNSYNHIYKIMQRNGILKLVIADLFASLDFEFSNNKESTILADVINYCYRNYHNDITLSDLEKELHTTKYYVSHLFKDKLETTFSAYINSLRINEACKLLCNTNTSITAIALNVGYNTVRSFNRCFIKEKGITPSEYRKQNKV